MSAYTCSLYFWKLEALTYILPSHFMSIFIQIFLAGSVKRFFFRKSMFRPFKVIQGH